MPEGPEVATIARHLHEKLQSVVIKDLDIDEKSRYYLAESRNKPPLKQWDQFRARLPASVQSVWSRGKKVIVQFETMAVFFSLGMEGKFKLIPEKHSNLWLEGPDFRLYFDDSRHFGSVVICLTPTQFEEQLEDLGLDLLFQRDQITAQVWKASTRLHRWPRWTIGALLMEQKFMSGIGNYLRAEILYASKINPFRLVETLTDEELERIRYWSIYLLDQSYASQGATIYTFESVNGEKGTFTMKVYNQPTDPLGHPVIRTELKGRTVHWVPEVQH